MGSNPIASTKLVWHYSIEAVALTRDTAAARHLLRPGYVIRGVSRLPRFNAWHYSIAAHASIRHATAARNLLHASCMIWDVGRLPRFEIWRYRSEQRPRPSRNRRASSSMHAPRDQGAAERPRLAFRHSIIST